MVPGTRQVALGFAATAKKLLAGLALISGATQGLSDGYPVLAFEDFFGPNAPFCDVALGRTLESKIINPLGFLSDQGRSTLNNYFAKNGITGSFKENLETTLFTLTHMLSLNLEPIQFLKNLEDETFKSWLIKLNMDADTIKNYVSMKNLLHSFPNDHFDWKAVSYQLTTDLGLVGRLQEMGVDNEFALQLAVVARVVKESKKEHFVATGVLEQFKKFNRFLVVCILGEKCSFRQVNQPDALFSSDAHFYHTKIVRSFEDFDLVAPKKEDGMFYGIFSNINVLFMKRPVYEKKASINAVNVIQYYALYIHEVTHFIDVAFFSRWLRANYKLVAAGQDPDEYYAKFVRFTKDKDGKLMLLVHRSLFRFFLESRAYAVKDHVMQTAMGFGPDHPDAKEYAEAGEVALYRQLELEIGADTLKADWGITEKNKGDYIAKAKKLTDVMLETEQKARAL